MDTIYVHSKDELIAMLQLRQPETPLTIVNLRIDGSKTTYRFPKYDVADPKTIDRTCTSLGFDVAGKGKRALAVQADPSVAYKLRTERLVNKIRKMPARYFQ